MNLPSERRGAWAAAVLSFLSSLLLLQASPARSEDSATELRKLRGEVEQLRRRDEESRARMAAMEKTLERVLAAQASAPASATMPAVTAKAATTSAAALDRALAGSPPAVAAAPSVATAALDRALAASAPAGNAPATTAVVPAVAGASSLWSRPLGAGGPTAKLIDISLITLLAGGGSTANDSQIADLEAGGHDPNQNGFTLQQVELSLRGAVDPYFTGEAHIVATTSGLELEEAFLQTTSLPFGLEVEAGYSLAEFGLMNPTHAHAWDWIDAPVAMTRFFGGDGLRSPGARVAWLMPTPFFSELHLGIQNADEGGYTASFMGSDGVGGRPNVARDVDSLGDMLWLGRWNASWDLTRTSALLTGVSALYGPNSTGNDGYTVIYGADVKYRWRSPGNFRGWPFFLWQAEVLHRDFKADAYVGGTDVSGGSDPHLVAMTAGDDTDPYPNDLPADTLHDTAFYTQVLYGLRWGWAAGLRAEYATGSGSSVENGVPAPRSADPTRDNRIRISPLLSWRPTEFSRLRLQYNYDNADFVHGSDAHTIWIGAEITYGQHGAHKY